MDERFYILPLGYDFFVTDSTGQLKPFIISDIKYKDVVNWFEYKRGYLDSITLDKIRLSEDETLFHADMNCKKYEYGFVISALSKRHLHDIIAYLS